MPAPQDKPLRLLIVCPSWVGDVVMATPTLRLVRRSLPGCFIGALVRPGLDELLDGSDFFDETHIARSSGVMGPKFIAAKIRPRRYDTVLLLTNSFSTALIARIAGIPRRIGYDRDARGLLLTDRLPAPTRADGSYAPIPAIEYYLRLASERLLHQPTPEWSTGRFPLELFTTPAQEAAASALLARAGLDDATPIAVLNPGGNNPAKRWPADRFAQLAAHLVEAHALTVLINGSPTETTLINELIAAAPAPVRPRLVPLPHMGITLGVLKAITRRARLMITNDTGPRHIAAAFGVPLVSLFGPTDHRWTSIPTRPAGPEALLLADPTLPDSELANDHPQRCRVDRIPLSDVISAADRLLNGSKGPVTARADWRTLPQPLQGPSPAEPASSP